MGQHKFHTVVKKVADITAQEMRQLYGYKKDGCIRDDLNNIRQSCKPEEDHWVSMLKDKNNRVRSWALAEKFERRHMVQIWTQHRWRRMGLGTRVIEAMRKVVPDFDVYKHGAPEFFESCNL